MKKEVLLLLTNHWADWEVCHATVGIGFSEDYDLKTIALDKTPKVSIGGLRTEIDYAIDEYQSFDNLAMIILAGGFSWSGHRFDEIADFIKKARASNTPIAAICGATLFLAKQGFLNDVKHTGDSQEYFDEMLADEKAYTGQKHFAEAQVVNDDGFITANETAALEFAREILLVLKTDDEEDINGWYEYHKKGMAQ